MSVLDNFSDWKEFLNQKIDQAQAAGMTDNAIQNLAYQIGDYLAAQVEPRNEEERVLKELWQAGNEQEQRALASLMVKMVDHK